MICDWDKPNDELLYVKQFKSLGLLRFYIMCLKEITCAHQGCIYLIKNTVKTLILFFIITG